MSSDGQDPVPEVLSLDELAERSGVSARTIRYYQSEDILPSPRKVGRDACYAIGHLERLEQISELLDQGETMSPMLYNQLRDACSASARAPLYLTHLFRDVARAARADFGVREAERAVREIELGAAGPQLKMISTENVARLGESAMRNPQEG